jgi:hypothetical protein
MAPSRTAPVRASGCSPRVKFRRGRPAFDESLETPAVERPPASEPCSPDDIAAIRDHPRFAEAVRAHAAGNLAMYAGLNAIERWLISDLGRTTLTAAAVIMSALPAGLSLGELVASARRRGFSSPGRVRLYVDRAAAYGLISPAPPATHIARDTPLVLADGFVRTATDPLVVALRSACQVAPAAAAALERMDDLGYRARVCAWIGLFSDVRRDLFPGDGRPIHLFQNRDGGMRMLEALIARRAAGRLLGDGGLSRAALARASSCSRPHVRRLLADGEALGLLGVQGERVVVSPELSDDVDRYYATAYAVLRTGALAVLAPPG